MQLYVEHYNRKCSDLILNIGRTFLCPPPTFDDKNRKIMKMLMEGFTQKQAAIEVSIANNGGVSKRLSKIRKYFTKKTGIKI